MGIEDAAALATLLSHIYHRAQIPLFLAALQDICQSRCQKVNALELDTMKLWSMPEGPEATAREKEFTKKWASGEGLYDGDENINIELYGYRPEDAAEDWWIHYGEPAEQAKYVGREKRSDEIMVSVSAWSHSQSELAAS